jgi:alkylhydroperoxidase/carboxymuconolactone decarboxylase family protein YurZ
MTEQPEKEAWVSLPSSEEVLAQMPRNKPFPYDFGFISAMRRLLMAHDRIGPAMLSLFAQVMFEPGFLTRREREMVAAVAAAAQDCHY